jgi:hypothetical protein
MLYCKIDHNSISKKGNNFGIFDKNDVNRIREIYEKLDNLNNFFTDFILLNIILIDSINNFKDTLNKIILNKPTIHSKK